MIEVRGITKKYGKKNVVDNVSLKIEEGKITSFIGPNGAGKSTLLSIISRLIKRDAGEVLIDGKEILELDNSVDEDINYLLSLGDKCNIHLIVSTDTLSNDDMVRIFTNNNTCKISFYMTTRGEYNIFLSNIVNESLNNDGMYLDSDKNLSRVIIPLIGDDEIERVVKYLNNK